MKINLKEWIEKFFDHEIIIIVTYIRQMIIIHILQIMIKCGDEMQIILLLTENDPVLWDIIYHQVKSLMYYIKNF
jgi:hypothetical protein